MRQGEKHHVVAGKHARLGGLQDARGQRRQMGMMVGERAAGIARGGERAEVSRPSEYAGWPSSSRRISPPAYPLAPATATVVMRAILHDYATLLQIHSRAFTAK